MDTVTTLRSRILPGFVLLALGIFTSVWAAPTEVFIAASERVPGKVHALTLPTAQPEGAPGSMRPVALRRLQPHFSATPGFYETYLVPRMSARLRGERAVAPARFASSTSNPWTSDPDAADRVEKRAIRAVRDAFKRYAIVQLGIDRWSLPLTGRRGGERATRTGESGAVRLRFGVSHLAPRADLLIPVATGRVVVSADARGRLGTAFEPTSSRLRLAADVNLPEHAATVGLSWRF